MSYKLAIFDLDGTILDTLDDLTDSTNHALTVHGLPRRTRDEVRSFVGSGARLLIERAVPTGCSTDTTNRVFAEFQSYYKAHSNIKTKPYSGIIDALNELKANGIKLALLSNKPDFAVQTLCERYFDGIFSYAAGERAGIPRKPAPDAVNAILESLDADRRHAVYIGDSDVDIETAKNADMFCISVTWGFRDETFLRDSGAMCIVTSPHEMADEIMRHE